MQQALDGKGRIYYIDENGNKVQPQGALNPFQKFGRNLIAKTTNLGSFLNESNPDSDMYKQKTNIGLALATLPIGGGVLGANIGKALVPFLGKKIGQMVGESAGAGLLSGGLEGFGRGLIEQKNPIKTAVQDGTIGLVTGSLGGLGVGKIGKQFAKRNLYGDEVAQTNYFNDYIEGLNNNTSVGVPSRFNKEWQKFNELRAGNKLVKETMPDIQNPLHVAQAELINKYNPAPNSYNTWIRSANDIFDFEDTLKEPNFDPDFIGNDFDPSYSWDMAQQAIKDGEIDVYSSYPIDKGVFVTPSTMEAQSYAGNGKIFHQRVPLRDVAWIDPTQGQYAPIRNVLEKPKSNINPEPEVLREIPPYKESNFYKQRQARLKAKENPRQLSNSDNNLYEKLVNMSKDYKNGEYNPLKYKGKSVKIDNISPKQKEYIFNEVNSTASDIEKEKGLVTRRLHNYDEEVDYLYTTIYDKDGNHEITRSIKIDEDFYDKP